MTNSFSKIDSYKLYLAIIFLLFGFIGTFITYSMHDNFDSRSTFYENEFNNDHRLRYGENFIRDETGIWYQGGVSIDSAEDGVATGLGVISGFLILSGSMLIISLPSNHE